MVETLRTDLTARDRTRGAFASAQRNVDSFTSKVGGLKAAFTAAFAVAGVAALVRFTRQALDTADSIGKVADRIGISTKALQEYRFAFDLAGVSQERTDRALQSFTTRLGELQLRGKGTLDTFLRDFNPALREQLIAATDAGDALDIATRAMSRLESASQRAGLAGALFGNRIGVELANGLKNSARGLEENIRRANDLGLILEEELIRNAESAKDRLTEMERAISLIFTRVVVQNAAELATAFERITLAAVEFGKFAGLIPRTLKEQIAEASAAISESLDDLEVAQTKRGQESALRRLASAESALADLLERQTDALERQNSARARRNALSGGGDQAAAIRRLSGNRAPLITDETVLDAETIEDAINAMTDDAETFATVLEDAEQPMSALDRIAQRVGKSLSSGISAAAQQFDDLESAGISFLRIVLGAAGSAVGQVLGEVAAKALVGSARGNVLVGGFQAFQAGGIVGRPTLGLIGEGGQNEAVVPLPDGRRIPVDLGGSGAGPVQINMNFALGLNAEVRAALIQMLPELQDAFVVAMTDARLRGGDTAQAFAA